MGTRKRFLGWYLPGIGHPLFSYPPFDEGNGHQPRSGPGPASLTVATGEETIHLFPSPFWEGHGGVLAGRSGSGMERTNAAVDSHLREFSEQ